mmetsp:Transcript_32250/g.65724  ORF Transcript_32250/g.65724 Transcript_32250/m.65724 type:complete len:324 (-) Transcript_32250:226-1197(-)
MNSWQRSTSSFFSRSRNRCLGTSLVALASSSCTFLSKAARRSKVRCHANTDLVWPRYGITLSPSATLVGKKRGAVGNLCLSTLHMPCFVPTTGAAFFLDPAAICFFLAAGSTVSPPTSIAFRSSICWYLTLRILMMASSSASSVSYSALKTSSMLIGSSVQCALFASVVLRCRHRCSAGAGWPGMPIFEVIFSRSYEYASPTVRKSPFSPNSSGGIHFRSTSASSSNSPTCRSFSVAMASWYSGSKYSQNLLRVSWKAPSFSSTPRLASFFTMRVPLNSLSCWATISGSFPSASKGSLKELSISEPDNLAFAASRALVVIVVA